MCSRGLVVAGALSFVKNAVLPYVLYEYTVYPVEAVSMNHNTLQYLVSHHSVQYDYILVFM